MLKSPAWVLALLVATSFFLSLDADPSRLLWRDFITDEGWWSAEARDKVLFGRWVMDEYNQGLTVPLATWVWWLSFKVLGVSLWAARLPSALAALGSVLLMGLLLRRWQARTGADPDPAAKSATSGEAARDLAPLAALLLATALPFAMFARITAAENLSLLLILAAWLVLALGAGPEGGAPKRGEGTGPGAGAVLAGIGPALLAGILFGGALSAKLSSVVALPALAYAARGDLGREGPPRWLRSLSPAVHFAFAGLLTWTLLRLPFGLAYAEELSVLELLHRWENLPATPVQLLANLALNPWPSPFLYQVAPLIALAGLGAWQNGLDWRGRAPASRALAWLLLAGLAQCLLQNPADRRFLIFLPALAVLAARGWRAIAGGEALWRPRTPLSAVLEDRVRQGGLEARRLPGAASPFWAAFALAFIAPGRLVLYYTRLVNTLGRPFDHGQALMAAAFLFLITFLVAGAILQRWPHRAGSVLRFSLVAGWLLICLEPFDFLLLGGLFHWLGHYDASRIWLEAGGLWAIPWGLVTLALVWIPLARGGLLPGLPAGASRPLRRILPALVPLLAVAVLAPVWLRPGFSLREAAATLSLPLETGRPCRALVGSEAPTLGLGAPLLTVALRDDFNLDWEEIPPSGSRFVRLMEDSGQRRLGVWPPGADSLGICPQRVWGSGAGAPRFLFAVWEPP